MSPESTWLGSCGQEMWLLGLCVLGLYDRLDCYPPACCHGSALLGCSTWLLCLMSHSVSPLMCWGFPYGMLCTSSWNKTELGVGVNQSSERFGVFVSQGTAFLPVISQLFWSAVCVPLAARIRQAVISVFSP